MTDRSGLGPDHLTTQHATSEAHADERAARTWDLPVVHALDRIEAWPGFEPDRVEWDHFRFWSLGSTHRMDWVTIYAYRSLTQERAPVRFAAIRGGSTEIGPIDAPLSVDDVAQRLDVPVESAHLATVALHTALAASLTEWNAAHAPGAVIQGGVQGQRAALPPTRRPTSPIRSGIDR